MNHADLSIDTRRDIALRVVPLGHGLDSIDFHGMPLEVRYDYTESEPRTFDEPGMPADCVVEAVFIGKVDVTYFFDANEEMRDELEEKIISMKGDV